MMLDGGAGYTAFDGAPPGQAAHAADVDHACVDLVEALLLRDRVGEVFDAVVVTVSADRSGGRVHLVTPPVFGRCDGDGLPLGEQVRVRLEEADPARRHVRFSRVA
ncbi:hypothetical protein [Spirillospora sp. NPDC048824]|uniref:hypothetical protein n=1 Tax=Spirillospora sp. NPDC048824 TaxID=3364526 RepID=UPI0037170122